MDDVLDQVAVAFEEDGVNRTVLDELKKVRLKICCLSVAVLRCAVLFFFPRIQSWFGCVRCISIIACC